MKLRNMPLELPETGWLIMERKREQKLVSIDDALLHIENDSFLAIGGFMIHNHPMGIIREIVKENRRNLKILPTPPGGSIDADLLIGCGCAASVVASYIGAEWLEPIMPNYRRKVEEGELEVLEYDEHTIICGLRASAEKLPCGITRAGLGTDLLKVNPHLKIFNNPVTGQPLVAVPPIEPDVAIIHAQRSDPYGNVQHAGSVFMDLLLAAASKKVIVSVDEVVPLELTRHDPFKTTLPCHLVTAVVHMPYGAHPCSSHGFYGYDEQHIRDYVGFAKRGDGYQEYLSKYIYNVGSLYQYLELVGGIRRLSELKAC